MFDYLESDDRRLLGEVGGKNAVAPLEKLIGSETDLALKSQAELALRKVQSRQP